MNNNRSRKTSGISSSMKLEPINTTTKSQTFINKQKIRLPTRKLISSENQYISSKNISSIIKKDDVFQLEKKIIGFDAKDDNNIPFNYLFNLRRNYDDISKQLVKKGLQISSTKGQMQVMKRTLTLQHQEQDAYRRKTDDLSKNIENIKSKQSIEQMTSKSLEAVIERMRRDQFVHKTRVTILDKRIKQIQANLKQVQSKNILMGEYQSSNLVVSSKVKQQYKQTSKQRFRNFDLYQTLISKKQNMEFNEQQRMRNTQYIQSMACNDNTDQKQINCKKLMMVNRFLRLILKRNVYNTQQKYEHIKRCYNSIRSKTTIDDPKQISRLYFQMQTKYKSSLEDITIYEQKQKQLLQTKSKLQKQWRLLQAKAWQCIQEQKEQQSEYSNNNIKQIDQKWLRQNLLQIRIKNCLSTLRNRLSSVKTKTTRQSQDVLTDFLQYFSNLLSVCEQISIQQQSHPKFNDLISLQTITKKDMQAIDLEQDLKQSKIISQ